jgi:hypothetical protein
MHTLAHYARRKMVHVNIFGGNSTKESLLVSLRKKATPSDSKELDDAIASIVQPITTEQDFELVRQAKERYLGKQCYVDWPYFQEGNVVGISTLMFRYNVLGEEIQQVGRDRDTWRKDALLIHDTYYHKKAVDIGEIRILFHVRVFNGTMVENPDGSIQRQFTDHELLFPAQLCFVDRPVSAVDHRTTERKSLSFDQRYAKGKEIIYIGPNNYYGCKGIIMDHQPGDQKLVLELTVSPPIPTFGREISSDDREHYYPCMLLPRCCVCL